MKNLKYIALVLVLMSACKNNTEHQDIDYAIISGKIDNADIEKTELIIDDADRSGQKIILLNPDNTFRDTIFNLKNDKKFIFFEDKRYGNIYLKKGANIEMYYDANDFENTLVFKNDAFSENTYLHETNKIRQAFYNDIYKDQDEMLAFIKSLSEDNIIEMVQKIENQLQNLWDTYADKFDPDFKTLEEAEKKLILGNTISTYKRFFTQGHPDKDIPESLLEKEEEYKIANINDEFLYKNLINYRQYVAYNLQSQFRNSDVQKQYSEDSQGFNVGYLDFLAKNVKSHYIKQDLIKNMVITALQFSDQKETVKAMYNKYVSTLGQETVSTEIDSLYQVAINRQQMPTQGTPAPDFTYEDKNGQMVSLSDFKGKYVYIDLWATWCVPCIREIPFLEKVQEKYKDNDNIVFLSISMDVQKKKDDWKQMIKDKNMHGIQLIMDKDFKSDLAQVYYVSGIPRFILIDPNGNTVDPDAPRPSEERLIELFNSLKI